jgi:uncharacterized membrane protein
VTWDWVAAMPSTNFRIFVSVLLEVVYVLVVLGAMVLGRSLPVEIVYGIGSFILVCLGISAAQFKFKRETFSSPSPDSTPETPATPTTPAGGRDMGET